MPASSSSARFRVTARGAQSVGQQPPAAMRVREQSASPAQGDWSAAPLSGDPACARCALGSPPPPPWVRSHSWWAFSAASEAVIAPGAEGPRCVAEAAAGEAAGVAAPPAAGVAAAGISGAGFRLSVWDAQPMAMQQIEASWIDFMARQAAPPIRHGQEAAEEPVASRFAGTVSWKRR